MRKSINISQEAKDLIKEVKQIAYPNLRITDSHVIVEAIKSSGYNYLKDKLALIREGKEYQSCKYTLDYESNNILSMLMDEFSADAIIKEALKQMQRINIYKKRNENLKNKHIKVIGTNGYEINSKEFMPAIYSISIASNDLDKKIVLYVGKTKLFSSRQGDHITSVFKDPSYFGLTENDLTNDKLSLVMNIEENIDIAECKNIKDLDAFLSEKEHVFINKLNPATQEIMNMKKTEEKRKCVQKKINELLDNK